MRHTNINCSNIIKEKNRKSSPALKVVTRQGKILAIIYHYASSEKRAFTLQASAGEPRNLALVIAAATASLYLESLPFFNAK